MVCSIVRGELLWIYDTAHIYIARGESLVILAVCPGGWCKFVASFHPRFYLGAVEKKRGEGLVPLITCCGVGENLCLCKGTYTPMHKSKNGICLAAVEQLRAVGR